MDIGLRDHYIDNTIMRSKLFIAAMMIFGLSGNMMAQEAKGTLVEEAKYEFRSHWFIQGQGGVGYTIGETEKLDLFSPAAALNVGYQISPVWAVRLGASGWEGRGGFPTSTFYNYDFNYVQGNLDAVVNLSNLFGEYRHDRVWNWYALAGIGVNYAFNNSEAVYTAKKQVMQYLWYDRFVSPAGRAGAGLDLRITDRIGINLEVNANVVSDHFNSKKAGNPDWQFNALAGLSIRLGKSYTKTEPVYAAPVVEEKPAPVVEKKPEVKQEVVVKYEPMTQNIFFDVNKSVIREDQKVKVSTLADFLNQHPEAKVTIIGYADKNTGNATINAKLSESRSAAVAEALKARGIAADRIITDSKGDTVQPFQVNEDNRVSVCIAK